jgi:hypothetical protein
MGSPHGKKITEKQRQEQPQILPLRDTQGQNDSLFWIRTFVRMTSAFLAAISSSGI